ncbi:hypothetical protein GBAR_LOCUS26249 [Geodia barretti]|uniref:Uncharacterized protein n=1 Tax=Geodia barretti TaxID=519541 RepID=A0AA35TI31_GEOBA|nr:hypothetical protein GBAR_LOCUS26249 [Geodia barretti]
MIVHIFTLLDDGFETDATKPDSLEIVTNKDRGARLGRVQVQYQTLGMRPDHQVVRWWMWNSVPPFQRS